MFNKLVLSRLFCFFATNPIPMMDVRAPETLVIRAGTVVEIPDFLFVVIANHRFPPLQSGSALRQLPQSIAYLTSPQDSTSRAASRSSAPRRLNWCTICVRNCSNCANALELVAALLHITKHLSEREFGWLHAPLACRGFGFAND